MSREVMAENSTTSNDSKKIRPDQNSWTIRSLSPNLDRKDWRSMNDLLSGAEDSLKKLEKATSFFDDVKLFLGFAPVSSQEGSKDYLAPSPSHWSTLSLSSKCPAEANKLSPVSGAPSNRSGQAPLSASSSGGGDNNVFQKARLGFEERGKRLTEVGDQTEELLTGAQGFAAAAKILRQQAENKHKIKKKKKEAKMKPKPLKNKRAHAHRSSETTQSSSDFVIVESCSNGEAEAEAEEDEEHLSSSSEFRGKKKTRRNFIVRGWTALHRFWRRLRKRKKKRKVRHTASHNADADDIGDKEDEDY